MAAGTPAVQRGTMMAAVAVMSAALVAVPAVLPAAAAPVLARATAGGANSSTVYIIRHGEKTWTLGCLDARGEARARSLAGVFNGAPSRTHETFFTPRALFANHYDDGVDCERCKQTLMPISAALNETIIFKFGYPKKLGGNQLAAEAILETATAAGVVLVAWEHVNIQYLTAALGVDRAKIPAWPGDDFDTVYVLRFTGRVLDTFTVTKQNFTGAPVEFPLT